jgi:hypothetical protein
MGIYHFDIGIYIHFEFGRHYYLSPMVIPILSNHLYSVLRSEAMTTKRIHLHLTENRKQVPLQSRSITIGLMDVQDLMYPATFQPLHHPPCRMESTDAVSAGNLRAMLVVGKSDQAIAIIKLFSFN